MILSIVLLIVAAFAKAVMDSSANGVLPWLPGYYWSKDLSWFNKWKNKDPRDGEAFPGSSTILSFLTDGWHLAQFVFLGAIFALIVQYEIHFSWWLDFIILRVIFGLAFEGFYRALKR